MVSFMVKYKNILLAVTILFFVGSLGFLGVGTFMEQFGPNAAIAIVGDKKITLQDFETAYRHAERNMRESGQELDNDAPRRLRQEVLQTLINEESLSQSARKYGIGVSDIEVGYDIRESFAHEGMFDKKVYVWLVRNKMGMNPAQYEELIKKQKMASKFQNMLILSSKATPQEAAFFLADEKPAKGAPAPDADSTALAIMEIKAQSLANSFTQQFNAEEKIELKHRDKVLGTPAQYAEYEEE